MTQALFSWLTQIPRAALSLSTRIPNAAWQPSSVPRFLRANTLWPSESSWWQSSSSSFFTLLSKVNLNAALWFALVSGCCGPDHSEGSGVAGCCFLVPWIFSSSTPAPSLDLHVAAPPPPGSGRESGRSGVTDSSMFIQMTDKPQRFQESLAPVFTHKPQPLIPATRKINSSESSFFVS